MAFNLPICKNSRLSQTLKKLQKKMKKNTNMTIQFSFINVAPQHKNKALYIVRQRPYNTLP